MATLVRKIMGAGIPAGTASTLLGDVQNSLTATGTSQSDAQNIGSAIARFTTVASGTGAILPAGAIGDELLVVNAGANALSLYPPVGHAINAGSTNAAISVATSSSLLIKRITNLLWIAQDASQLLFLQAGTGATPRSLQNKAREIITPEDFSANGDGTDDGTALTRFFNELMQNSAHVVGMMLSKNYGTSISLPTITAPILLYGYGAAPHDVGNYTGTRITALSGLTGTVLTIAPTEGASAQLLRGLRIIGLGIDCRSIAAKGIVMKSIRESDFDIFVSDATTTGLELNVATTLGEGSSLQYNRFRYTGRQVDAGGGAAGVSMRLMGDANGNPSFNWFERVDVVHKDAIGIIHENSDNNMWGLTRVARASGGSATNSIEWRGSDLEPTSCRVESYLILSSTVAAIAKGTSSYAVAAKGIYIHRLDTDNGTPTPTEETGATIYDKQVRTYTPTVAATSGTITTVGAVSGRYRRDIKQTWIRAQAAITTNGTGAGKVRITLPGPESVANGTSFGTGRANSVSGKQLLANFINGQQYMELQNYDDSYPAADGETLIVSGQYEVA